MPLLCTKGEPMVLAEPDKIARSHGASIFGSPAIDCDLHIAVPSIKVLMPYLDAYWRQQFLTRGIDRLSWNLTSDPPNAPISGRPDWRPATGKPGTSLDLLRSKALDGFGVDFAIANCLYGGAALHSEDMAAVVCTAMNDWIAKEWLDAEPRLRASIIVPLNNPELAAREIERCASDARFVQVLMLVAAGEPLGKRHHWPIYAAADKHNLPVCLHAGSLYQHPMTANGYGSYFLEDYVAQAFAFESAVLSLVSEGVFAKFPTLKFVFAESGISWLPAALWRFNKTWRGVRAEIPWVKRAPADIVRNNIRLTLQPFDGPDGRLERFCEQMDSDRMVLFSSDFPHWHYDGVDALPIDHSSPLAKRILYDNPRETYPRLRLKEFSQ
jgi:predicted TIM-barrel fold metal-dependent hydrolase